MLRYLARSLSFRLLAIFLVLGGLFVFGALQAIQWFYNSEDIRDLISGHLSLHVHYVREDLGTPPRIERAIAITRSVPVDIRISGPDIQWASDPNFPDMSELAFGPSPRFSDDPDAWVDELMGVEFAASGNHRFLKMRNGDYDIVVSTPRIGQQRTGPDLVTLIIILGLSFLLLGYAAVQWLFRPIRAIRKGTARIGRGDFESRIENIRQDQLGDLAADINQLAGDVENMLDAKRALLLGISHELRTPLSRMRLQLEFLDDESQRESIKTEIVEMEKIVDALLEAERLNTRHAELVRSEVDIGELVSALVDDFFSRDRHRLTISLPSEPLFAYVDTARLMLLLKNLLSNALRYSNPADGDVALSVEARADSIVFRVCDSGPGIPPEQASHIGEPFYRGDPSRARASGGTGLGLYLATLVARAHGGTLQLVEHDGDGACFEARLPRDPGRDAT